MQDQVLSRWIPIKLGSCKDLITWPKEKKENDKTALLSECPVV